MLSALRWLGVWLLVVPSAGCGGQAARRGANAPAPIPVVAPEAYASTRAERDVQRTGATLQLTGPLAGAPAVRAQRSHRTLPAAVAPTPPSAIPVQPARPERVELFDIEARVTLEVAELVRARQRLIELVRANDGQVMNEAVEDGEERRGAALSLRVPSERVRAFLASLNGIGKLRSSTLETKEVSRKIADTEILIRNLEQSLKRYEELLAKAANVAEATQVEAQLARVRTELERVKGDLEWSRDRVARATVYVTLALAEDGEPLEPEASIYPGFRAVFLVDVPPGSAPVESTSYAGGGLSLSWPRTFSVDLDLLTSLSEPGGGAIDFYFLTVGTELYSDFLGGGRRATFNPYIGLRTGFARGPGQSFFPLGGSVGVELYKTRSALIAVEARLYGLLGRKQGPDFGFEPGIGANFAY